MQILFDVECIYFYENKPGKILENCRKFFPIRWSIFCLDGMPASSSVSFNCGYNPVGRFGSSCAACKNAISSEVHNSQSVINSQNWTNYTLSTYTQYHFSLKPRIQYPQSQELDFYSKRFYTKFAAAHRHASNDPTIRINILWYHIKSANRILYWFFLEIKQNKWPRL